MKSLLNSRLFLVFAVFLMAACTGSEDEDTDGFNRLEPDVLIEFDEGYQVAIPAYFEEMYDISPDAILQYGYVSNEKDSTKADYEDEVFLAITKFAKVDLEVTFSDTGRVTLNRFNTRTALNLELILDDLKVENYYPKPTLINGLAAIKNSFVGRLGDYLVFYKMAIYETETDFYQLLIWCMQKHADKHKSEMDGIIHSFENL